MGIVLTFCRLATLRVRRSIIMLLLLFTCSSLAPCLAQNSEELWKQFRTEHPLHLQAVLVSKPNAERERTLIIAEPPPHITLTELKGLSPLLAHATVRRSQIGVDGWVSDIVVSLPDVAVTQLDDLVVTLHEHLFGTAYKAYALPLSEAQPAWNRTSLDLRVTATQLQRWFIGDVQESDRGEWSLMRVLFVLCMVSLLCWRLPKLFKQRRPVVASLTAAVLAYLAFQALPAPGVASGPSILRLLPVTGEPAVTAQTLMRHPSSGVYRSAPAGFIVWSLPKGKKLNSFLPEARQFALDSDLFVGGISNEQVVLVIGRERQQPVTVLPPVRAETLLQLASVKQDELAQSYERRFLYAGRYAKAEALDWAPIYLSDQLVNTEFGSLLNITDQLLKSWSLNGEITYKNFAYATPVNYPFPRPLMTELGGHTLTFNWNTKGAAYVKNDGGVQVFALHRTGALPIDYLSEGNVKVREAEDTAYEWYSQLGDPNLARVVEYAGLFQLFTQAGVGADVTTPTRAVRALPLQAQTAALLPQFIAVDLDDMFAGQTSDDALALQKRAVTVQQALHEFMGEASAAQQQLLIDALSDAATMRELMAKSDQESQSLAAFASETGRVFQAIGYRENTLLAGIAYQKAVREWMDSGNPVSDWIGTPSIVISHASGSLRDKTGGHNLGSAHVNFQVDSRLAPGQIRIARETDGQTVFHSAADSDALDGVARTVGRDVEHDAADVQSAVERALSSKQRDTRSMADTLHLTVLANTAPASAGGRLGLPGGAARHGWEWQPGPRAPQSAAFLAAMSDMKLAADGRKTLVITRRADLTFAIDGSEGAQLTASSIPAAIDAIRTVRRTSDGAEANVLVYLRGMDGVEARGFSHSADAHLGSGNGVKILREGTMVPEEIKAIELASYDFRSATITKMSTPELVDGRAIVHGEITVKPTSLFGKHVVLRIKLLFNSLADATRFAQKQLERIVAQLGDAANMALATRQMRRDLKIAFPGLKEVDITVVNDQSRDLYLVRGPAGQADDTADTAG